MTFPTAALASLADVSVAFAPPPLDDLPDAELMDVSRLASEIRRRADAVAVLAAAELKRRSAPELGHNGLAQRLGVREITATPTRGSAPDLPSWLSAVGSAVRGGSLSVTAADAIRTGLGVPCEGVPAEALARAAASLVALAPTVTVEQLAAHARALRDELDEDGIADRAERLRDMRYLRLIPRPDRMTRLDGLLDPESAAIVAAAYNGDTSPRRQGVRFVDPELKARAEELLADPRTTEQIALDAFVDLVRVGSAVDGGTILPFRRPEVVVHVQLADLDRRAGAGHLEGQPSALPIPAVERHICEAVIVPVLFDGDRRVIDIGVPQRLFTRRQRIALAARDGGCAFTGCDRPPSWTEAHHLQPWSEGGATSISNGILLCRHHHLLVHDHGWGIRRVDGTWQFDPPPAVAALAGSAWDPPPLVTVEA
jgi:hypothetical protein